MVHLSQKYLNIKDND